MTTVLDHLYGNKTICTDHLYAEGVPMGGDHLYGTRFTPPH